MERIMFSRCGQGVLVAFVLFGSSITAVAAASAQAAAQTQQPDSCRPAGSSIRIQVSVDGTPPVFTYVVTNNRQERLQWVRIGAGGGVYTVLLPAQEPTIAGTPADWRGVVVHPEETNQVLFLWEATSERAELSFRSRTAFSIRDRIGPGGRPIAAVDFTSLPFSAGSGSGSCWWGKVTPPDYSGPEEGGIVAGLAGAALRPIAGDGKDYVILDAPMLDIMMRIAHKPVFLTIPVALSWGVKGGFSADASIGIGLSWSPIKYVSTFAQTQFGTFFFNNRTYLSKAGFDINIPIGRMTFVGGATRQSKYLVVGAEYFHRDVTEWAGFVKEPQWYASGQGLAIRFGIRSLAWDGP